MPKLSSTIDRHSPAFKALETHNRALRDELRARVAEAALGGPEASRDRHVKRGKLLFIIASFLAQDSYLGTNFQTFF